MKIQEQLSRRLHQYYSRSIQAGSILVPQRMDAAMANYKTTNKLGKCDAAYIAGLIDGEGSISLVRRHRNENRQLEVSVSNTDINLLKYLVETIGTGRISNKRTISPNHTPSATYTVSNRQALSLLEQVTPHLRTYKLTRARLVLDNYLQLTPRNGKYTKEILYKRDKFIQIFMNTKPV